jgi:Tfp pilus assembly protein FimT
MVLVGIGLVILAVLAWLAYKKFQKTVNQLTSPWQRLQNLFS